MPDGGCVFLDRQHLFSIFQILPFIEDLHSDHLRQQLHSQWESRYRSVYRLELDRIIVTAERLLQFEPSAFESHSDIIRVDGFLDYPSVANQLLAARALHGRLMATFIPTDEWTVEHEPCVRYERAHSNILTRLPD